MQNHIKRLHLILTRLSVSETPEDMRLPGLKLHKLKGNLKEHWAVFISGNWRLTFKFDGYDIIEINYLDYH